MGSSSNEAVPQILPPTVADGDPGPVGANVNEPTVADEAAPPGAGHAPTVAETQGGSHAEPGRTVAHPAAFGSTETGPHVGLSPARPPRFLGDYELLGE